ncbi:PH domain-containing protein [Paraglaciecola sp.]|uniref:PH domain-containing protein n=1 Tax=Paraglaciecola sp. TaxID=1920173 RepID=UPI00273D981F|nr:PH domain-containing protein [Paraglaciecola sp.]MDP5029129.1 PH domain-containing protein [Paraglaciecola sp.]
MHSVHKSSHEHQPVANDWQKLSPIAIVYFVMKIIRGVFANIVYLIPALAYSYSNIIAYPYIWLPILLISFTALLLGAFWSFQVYRFRLSDNVLEIRSGLFRKKHVNLPFERIQNVKIEQPLYYRLTGYACLQLDTAGSAKQEAQLVALPLVLAQQLKQQILRVSPESSAPFSAAPTHAKDSYPPFATDEQLINQRSLPDLVLHGITNNRVWILLGGLAPFYDNIVNKINILLMDLGINLNDMFNLQVHSLWQVGIYTLSLTLLFMFLLMLFSVTGAIISYYGYTLSKTENRYIRRSGLFTKHEVSMPLSRLQMLVQQQDWLDILLKRVNLKLEQMNARLKQADHSAANNKIIVPSITLTQSRAIIDDIYPNNQLANVSFSAISGFFMLRYIGYYLFPLCCLIQSIAIIKHNIALAAIGLVLFALLSTLVFLRWRRWGYAFDENFVYLRKGLLGVDYYCFPAFKVQQCQFKQSIMMKRRHLATVKYVLASGAITIPLMPETIALGLINRCLYQVESSQRSWM